MDACEPLFYFFFSNNYYHKLDDYIDFGYTLYMGGNSNALWPWWDI